MENKKGYRGGRDYYKKQGRTKPVVVYLSPTDHQKLKDLAKGKNRSIQGQVKHWIEEGLERDAK